MRALGIRTVIDLRSLREITNYPESLLKIAGLRHFNVPIVTDESMDTRSPAEDYRLLLRDAHEGFHAIFSHLANDHYPLVINCFAGKDRTGLTSALILGALGVPDDVIVADYAFSEQHMVRLMDLHERTDEVPTTGVLPAWLGAAAGTMEATLHTISEEWGSVHGYLESIGISEVTLQQIREALVESVDEQQEASSESPAI
jgi:protein-tyrosine phosphatase